MKALYKSDIIKRQVELANISGKPLLLVMLATKPCYIKLASLIKALGSSKVPHLIMDSGQHYEKHLTSALDDFEYRKDVSVYLGIRGNLISRTSDLALKLTEFAKVLVDQGLKVNAIPIVSGDTSTAGMTPILWYFQSNLESIHIEAGLRSSGPALNWMKVNPREIFIQRQVRWKRNLNMPFPEGVCTRLATQVSQLLFAPTIRNQEELLREGNEAEKIIVSGSLSVDAIELASAKTEYTIEEKYPLLEGKSWIRIDIHRRENMNASRLKAIFDSIIKLALSGESIIFILTNAMKYAISINGYKSTLKELEDLGVLIQPVWDSYKDVILFIRSSMCRLIYTDSGGLQEESQILGVPCLTCRFETDRPETILETGSNLLIPPISGDFIFETMKYLLYYSNKEDIWPGSRLHNNFYGQNVASKITETLRVLN